jgi:uncharacterized protein
MMGQSNEDLIRQVYTTFGAGDIAGFFELLTDDFEWHMAGQFPLAGDYRGTDEMAGLFAKIFELLGPNGTLLLEPEHIFTNDEYAVGLIRYKARRGDDKAMDMRNVHVWRVRDGKVAEYWFHPSDLHVVESFWN